jgi:hypothetical protein
MGTADLYAYVEKYGVKLSPHLTSLLGQHSRKGWNKCAHRAPSAYQPITGEWPRTRGRLANTLRHRDRCYQGEPALGLEGSFGKTIMRQQVIQQRLGIDLSVACSVGFLGQPFAVRSR